MRLVPRLSDPILPALCAAERGNAFRALGQVDSALANMRRSLAVAMELHDTLLMVATSYNTSEYLTDQARYTESLEMRIRALRWAEAPGVEAYMAPIHQGMGRSYQLMHRFEEALTAFTTAERIARTYGMQDLWPLAQAGRADVWSMMDSTALAGLGVDRPYEQSRTALDSAFADEAPTGQPQYLAEIERIHGRVAHRFEDLPTATTHLERALALYQQAGNEIGIAETRAVLGQALVDANRHARAEAQLREALVTLHANSMLDSEADALHTLHRAQQGMGHTAAALASLQRAHHLRELARNDSTTKAIADLEARYDFDKKQYADSLNHASEVKTLSDQRVIAELRSEKANTRALAFGGGALLLAVGGGLAYRSDRKRRQAQHEQQTAELRQQASELENRALRAQMDPHFISNTLNAVNSSLHTNDADAASTLLMRFAEWIRTMLETSRHDRISLRAELDALNTYLSLEQLRTEGKFDFHIDTHPALALDAVQVPPLIVQPFLENAIEHGFGAMEQGGELRVKARPDGDRLIITVEDNGEGRKAGGEGKRAKKTSLSSVITRERLQLLRERTGRHADYTITDLPQGTRVEIILPVVLA
ncbi:MAG: histidine kinase [Flavobacteriales bacterium]|nr:histidine kinase [Flavobacteriales bacterium]